MMAPQHFTDSFKTKAKAGSVARFIKVKRRGRADTKPTWCEPCRAWHVTIVDGKIGATDRAVLNKIAQGMRAHEIAVDIGETYAQVVNRVKALSEYLDSVSRANLIAIAIYYGLVDVSEITIGHQRKEPHG